MRDRLLNIWALMRSSLWFVPALLTGIAVATAFGMLELDRFLTSDAIPVWRFPGGPQEARDILSIIATAVVAIAGVSFSMTIVALSLAASQFNSLLLTSYLSDAISQWSLGIFVATFVYCLLVLSHVSEVDGRQYVPVLSVTLSLLLAVLSLAAFVIFISHLAQSLQSERLAARIGGGLLEALSAMFPEPLSTGQDDEPAPEVTSTRCQDLRAIDVVALVSGYLQGFESDGLLAFAKQRDVVIQLNVRPGDFISAGSVVASALGVEKLDQTEVARGVTRRLMIGHQRTPTQDPEYSVHQLAQTAVRALSPAINDPYTALICIDWLEASLRLVTRRRIPSWNRMDEQGRLRVIAPGPAFAPVANAAFNKLRHAGRNHTSIMLRMLKAVEGVALQATRPADRNALFNHLNAIREDACAGLLTEREKREMEALYQEIKKKVFDRNA